MMNILIHVEQTKAYLTAVQRTIAVAVLQAAQAPRARKLRYRFRGYLANTVSMDLADDAGSALSAISWTSYA